MLKSLVSPNDYFVVLSSQHNVALCKLALAPLSLILSSKQSMLLEYLTGQHLVASSSFTPVVDSHTPSFAYMF
ncbi:MAG: hypothetical protein M1495_16395 [Bacteroidetes bacterium]|nr:hypothetical protein [Bacteroidota bacterium]